MACAWECKKIVIGRLSFQLNMSVTFKSYHYAKICYIYHYCHNKLNVYCLGELIGSTFHKITRGKRKALSGLVSRDLRKCLKTLFEWIMQLLNFSFKSTEFKFFRRRVWLDGRMSIISLQKLIVYQTLKQCFKWWFCLLSGMKSVWE